MTAQQSVGRVAPLVVLGLAGCLGLLAGASPTLALIAVSAAAFIAVLLASFPVATGIFIAITFVNLPDNAAKAVGVLLGMALLARIAANRTEDVSFSSVHPVAAGAMALFMGWTVLGLLWAESPRALTTELFRYSLNFVLVFVVFAAVRTRRDLLVLVLFFVVGSAIAAAYGLVHPPAPGGYDDPSRAGGTLGDPNELAAVLVVGLLLSAALTVVRSLPAVVRVGALVSALLCVVGIALSLSRGGLLALGMALLIGVFVAGRWRVHMAALAVAVVVGTVGYFATSASPQALQRITSANGGSGRADIWRVGWRMFEAHPVNGVGAGNYPVVSVHYLLRPGTITASRYIVDDPKVAHNMYLNVLVESGIVGAALLLGILVFALSSYRIAWRGLRRAGDRDLEIIAYAAFIGLVGFLAASFFLSEELSKQLWILIALGPAMSRLAAGQRRVERSPV